MYSPMASRSSAACSSERVPVTARPSWKPITATRPSIWKLKVKVLPFSSSKPSAGETLAALFDSSGISVGFSANAVRDSCLARATPGRPRHLNRVGARPRSLTVNFADAPAGLNLGFVDELPGRGPHLICCSREANLTTIFGRKSSKVRTRSFSFKDEAEEDPTRRVRRRARRARRLSDARLAHGLRPVAGRKPVGGGARPEAPGPRREEDGRRRRREEGLLPLHGGRRAQHGFEVRVELGLRREAAARL